MSKLNWEKIETADGSPTLSIDGGEKMHSMEGAFSESLHIYGPCIDEALKQVQPKIFSMGLGLGYNELIAVAQSMVSKKEILICSCEKLNFLRENFTNWLQSKPSELSDNYNQILALVANQFEIETEALQEKAREMFESEKLILSGSFDSRNPWSWSFHGICYDAYSSETDSYLWEQEFLTKSLSSYADDKNCCLSTYAATGNLKRALKEMGFEVQIRKGFGMKRNSTFAQRL